MIDQSDLLVLLNKFVNLIYPCKIKASQPFCILINNHRLAQDSNAQKNTMSYFFNNIQKICVKQPKRRQIKLSLILIIKIFKQYNTDYSIKQVRMKLQIKSVLKSTFNKIRCVEERQILYPAGNSLYLTQIGKNQGQFIFLDKQNSHLFDFVVTPNCRNIFTAEKSIRGVQVCSYTLQSQRKAIRLSQFSNYLPIQAIETIQLLTDQFQSSVVYVLTKSKTEACVCVSVLDMFKLKILAQGFVNQFNQGCVCSEQTSQISICGKGFLRRLKAIDNAWQVDERMPKKLLNYEIVVHLWLPIARCLLSTRTSIYIISDNEILQNFTNLTSQQDPIIQCIRIANGFILITEKGHIKLFCSQGQEALYTMQQSSKVHVDELKIKQVEYNKKTEQLYIVTNNGKFYYSKVEEANSASSQQNYFNFQQIRLSHSFPEQGTISTANINYCLISSEKNVQLWDLIKLQPTIILQASSLGQDKVIKGSALNPDGHSLCIGYSDKVRFYRILLNKFKQFGQCQIKNTTFIQYSHGGQLVAVIFGKGINSSLTVLNTLNLKQLFTLKLGFKPAQVVWNEHDDEVFVSGQDTKIIAIYQISSESKKISLHFQNPLTYIRFDYLTRKIAASTGNEIHLIDSDHKVETIVKPNIHNFDYVFPVEGVYIGTDKNGGIYCSNSIQFDKFQYISLFRKEKFNIIYKKGLLIVYSSPANVILLKLKLNVEQNKSQIQENIVLVQRDQIIKFFDKVKILEGQIDQLQTITTLKLDEQKKIHDERVINAQNKFKQQIRFLQKKLSDLQTEKSLQEKSHSKIFEELESGQIRNVNDLEKVYDLKIRLQKEKFLGLEQQNLEQKMKYENIIKSLEQKHHLDIERTRKQYSQKLAQQLKSMQSQKQRHMEYKKKAQTKIIDIQQQNQMTVFQLQMNKDSQIKTLSNQLFKLQREYDAKIIALHRIEEQKKQLSNKYNDCNERIKKGQKVVQENINKVSILQKEIQKKNRIIQEKNSLIEYQAHQIDGLQKAKYVLSFRTTQVRKELQPKQSLIEKLKSQLFKLDQQYKSETKKNFQLNQKLQKIEKICTNFKKQVNDLKTQIRGKERVHNDLCSELFLLVNNIDQKQWNTQIIKIYQNYIHEERLKFNSQKKEDPTSEQINRHLIHVQQSLQQVATGNEKMLKGRQKQVMRKMKQNAELVYDLNLMRKRENQLLNEIKQKTTEISRLRRQVQESSLMPRSTRANTAVTGATRRAITRDGNTGNPDWLDLSMKRQSTYLLNEKPGSKRGRVFSAHKTMMWRDEGKKQKSKLSDLARELQTAKNTIMRQQRMIQQLNQSLLGLPSR